MPQGDESFMFIDSHSHFNLCIDEGATEEELLQQMSANHVLHAVQVSTDAANFTWSREFSNKHPHILYTLGIHPSSDYTDDDFVRMEQIVEESVSEGERLFGIGETGLDYHWMAHPRETQMENFSSHIEIAGKYGLPLIVHNRDAHEDAYYVLKSMDTAAVIIHCFSGTKDDAKRFLDLGYYISFAGNVTFKKAVELQDALAYVPADRILFETDCPFLTPVPHRGKKNRPDYVRYVYQFAADYRNEDVEYLKDAVCANFSRISPVELTTE
ncbi:MAG: TatD family hydrolase [Spirochaetota bacterium]